MDMEEDAEILATLLKHIPSCMSADDIEKLLQDIPVQPPVLYIDATFIKQGIPIRPIYSELQLSL
jgi:hypothetical protein